MPIIPQMARLARKGRVQMLDFSGNAAWWALLLHVLSLPILAQQCTTTVEGNREAIVRIHVKKTKHNTGAVEQLYGTGFIVSPSGYVLTSDHVVEQGTDIDSLQVEGAIGSDAASASALEIISHNKDNDVALLRFKNTNRQYASVILGNAGEVASQELLCSAGYPQDTEYVTTSGNLSGKGGPGGTWYTQMPSNQGESGAPVFTASGEVVALKKGGYEKSQNLNVLVPLNLAQNLLNLVPDRNQGPPYEVLKHVIADAWQNHLVRYSQPDREAWDALTVTELDNCVLAWDMRTYSRFPGNKVIDQVMEERVLLNKIKRSDITTANGDAFGRPRWSLVITDNDRVNAIGVGRRNLIGPFSDAPIQFGQFWVAGVSFSEKQQAEKAVVLLKMIVKSCQ
jgi:hypothetical protein